MRALRWTGVLFLLAGLAAAPLNLLHAKFFSGTEIARVPLLRVGAAASPQTYPPLLINLAPEQSPVVVSLEATYGVSPTAADTGNRAGGASNRYTTRLISGSTIAAQSDATLTASGTTGEARLVTITLLQTKINTAGVYTVLANEAVAPGITLTQATLTVRANARRADIVNILAGIAFMLIGVVTLFATGKRRLR